MVAPRPYPESITTSIPLVGPVTRHPSANSLELPAPIDVAMPGASTSIVALIMTVSTVVAASIVALTMTVSSIVATSIVAAISLAAISGFDNHGGIVVVGVGSDRSDDHATDESTDGGDGLVAGPGRGLSCDQAENGDGGDEGGFRFHFSPWLRLCVTKGRCPSKDYSVFLLHARRAVQSATRMTIRLPLPPACFGPPRSVGTPGRIRTVVVIMVLPPRRH